ncbi:hypothetical protein [Acinetobacter sp. HY1485]|uniref:hypothetical protein n=1 Tax=Acinetobacter sp. HY1485 TaxID=2970918 RepID=UPI0022B9C9F6|nr:hypothetical protein [Acinetobacter sp. HY1485]
MELNINGNSILNCNWMNNLAFEVSQNNQIAYYTYDIRPDNVIKADYMPSFKDNVMNALRAAQQNNSQVSISEDPDRNYLTITVGNIMQRVTGTRLP